MTNNIHKITIRVDDVMKQAIDKMAQKRDTTVSEYIRQLILADVNKVNSYTRNKDGYGVWETIGDKPHII